MNLSQPFAAALIAGGKSRRMGGVDKALLEFGETGEPLWRIQLGKLVALEPAQLLISGRNDLEFEGAEWVPDAVENAGPLAGIAACLESSTQPLLLCLAVDMPSMLSDFLAQHLLARAEPDCGVVPIIDGRWEPFAAVFPTSLASLARERLAGEDHSLQAFVREAEERGQIQTLQAESQHEPLFRNLNTPEDWAAYR
jgi:molybdopterin-guanine dinucleotide biosynthesis protein A